MNKKSVIILLLLFVLVFSFGCVGSKNNHTEKDHTENVDPYSRYTSAMYMFLHSKNVYVKYDYNFMAGKFGEVYWYMKDGDYKYIMSLASTSGDVMALYKIKDNYTFCSEQVIGGVESRCREATYEEKGAISLILNLSDTDTYTINYSGEKEILGRNCFDFIIHPTSYTFWSKQPGLGNLFGGDTNYTIETCLDEETGAPLYLSLSSVFHSEISGENMTKELLKINATDIFVGSVLDKDIVIPS